MPAFGGMSEWTMMTGGESNWKAAYTLLIVGMAVIGGINYFFIRGFEKGIFYSKKRKPDEAGNTQDLK